MDWLVGSGWLVGWPLGFRLLETLVRVALLLLRLLESPQESSRISKNPRKSSDPKSVHWVGLAWSCQQGWQCCFRGSHTTTASPAMGGHGPSPHGPESSVPGATSRRWGSVPCLRSPCWSPPPPSTGGARCSTGGEAAPMARPGESSSSNPGQNGWNDYQATVFYKSKRVVFYRRKIKLEQPVQQSPPAQLKMNEYFFEIRFSREE